ncbi:MAG: Sensor protein kinase WalK [Alphaproteobacteria bacterium MarineAlpha9_Bin3]|nr:MAG: Sensor protein kinase WalK [Alphaproteobacteria bacterium MarineAlpha9_Bin3]|tara:strand:+ start:50063 stop:52252 length:2190 start_codon:yes stop_codon:yes gene_type:complete
MKIFKLNKTNNGVKRSWFLVVASLVSGMATYAAMTPSGDANKFLILILLNLDLVLLISLIIIITKRVVNIWSRKKSGQLGAQLHSRVVVMFSLLAAAPAIVVAIFGAIFFTVGIENWFSAQVKNALNKSLSVSEAYFEQGQRQINIDAVDIAGIMNTSGILNNMNNLDIQKENNLKKLLNQLAYERNFTEVIIFDKNGNIVAESELSFLFKSNKRQALFDLVIETKRPAIEFSSSELDKTISAMSPVNFLGNHFIYISKFKDLRVISDINSVKTAVKNYRGVENKKEGLHITFTMVFIVVAVLLMFVAILMGLNFANGLVTPITNLANAAERVSMGDLKVRVPDNNNKDEIADLSKTFNKMTEQLDSQRNDLINTNNELERRIKFTETVLTGVTAGVLGLDKYGKIFLPNRRALDLLDLKKSINNSYLIDVVPEMSEIFTEITNSNQKIITKEIELIRNGKKIIIITTITAEKNKNEVLGYVVTFDDMTEFFKIQRVAAWSDVARRIAHEIKNPLTPIQLAAERIKRKYKNHISLEPEIFLSCISTIIRQVDGMRKMVNEFSAFARMPVPVFSKINLTNLVKEITSLSILSNENIKVDIKVPKTTLYAVIDENQIRQALQNIISNGINSMIERKNNASLENMLTVELKKNKNIFNIIVTDSGIGLPDNIRDDLTDPYVTSRKNGTGLGLAIVKKIMEDHSGTLELKNVEGNSGVCASLKFISKEELDKG